MPFFASLSISLNAPVNPFLGACSPLGAAAGPLACAFLSPFAHSPYQTWITATPVHVVDSVLPGCSTRALTSERKSAVGDRDVLPVALEAAELRMKTIPTSWRETLERKWCRGRTRVVGEGVVEAGEGSMTEVWAEDELSGAGGGERSVVGLPTRLWEGLPCSVGKMLGSSKVSLEGVTYHS